MYVASRDKGIHHAKLAVEEDAQGNYQEAMKLYNIAVDWLMNYLKHEKTENMKQPIHAKVVEYITRMEYLKENEADMNSGKSGANGSNTGVKARKPGSGGKDDDDKEKDRMKQGLMGSILGEKPNVKWDDVAGLESAKEALKEAVILPVKFPQFFTGKRKPWSGILLYGPPGTGKSYLAKAVATEANSTFFSVSSQDLVSKWLGESEKLVSQLFSVARERSPSIIFIDEIDSLCSSRGDNESEAARRIKTQLMVEIQGVGSNNSNVLVLGATNLPYNLDQAIRRRFDKRIYIPLPEPHARAHMFKIHLGDTPHHLNEEDYQELGRRTEGFSGSDVSVCVKDVLMQPIRLLRESTHFKCVRDRPTQENPSGEFYVPCAPSDQHAQELNLQYFADTDQAAKVVPPPITMRDFEKVLLRARPTVGKADLQVFENFTQEFGEEAS